MIKAKRITFICDGKDCKTEKTVTENKYNMSLKHYCSTSCRTTGLKDRKTNRVADPNNSISYVCDRHDCNKEKTIYKSLYSKNINHFCSRDCFEKSRRDRHIIFPYKNTKTMQLKIAKRKKISEDIAEYFKKDIHE